MDINELDKREFRITALRVPLSKPMDLNDGLRINLWHLEITDRSFSILYQVLPLFVSLVNV